MHSPVIIPLSVFALVVVIVAIMKLARIRDKEIEVHQRLHKEQLEHQRRMHELQLELDQVKSKE